MKRHSLLLLMLVIFGVSAGIAANPPVEYAQQPVPTLVPPTLVPQPESGTEDILPTRSTVARIAETGIVRVGMLYNAFPFGELDIRGAHAGFDADLARAMAELWGVEAEFMQVTRDRQAAAEMLRLDEVDMLIAAQVRERELDPFVDFSETYYLGRQAMMVRSDDPATTPSEMANRRVGVVIASPAQKAINDWIARTGIPLTVQTYLTLDRAYVALAAGELDGMVDSAYKLERLAIQRPDLTRILDAPIELEPLAIAVLRQDASMRKMVNRTLQYLTTNGQFNEIYQIYFPGAAYERIAIWDNLGEEPPTPAQYPPAINYPTQPTLARIQSGEVLRVAGLVGVTSDSDAPESQRRYDIFHRNLVNAMAERWGVSVEFIPNSSGTSLQLLADGEADLAVGVAPDWTWADRVDFTAPYMYHGERMMVRLDSSISSFVDLQAGSLLVTPNNEPTAAPRAVEIGRLPNVGVPIDILQVREEDLAFTYLVDEDNQRPQAVFGSSFRLIPHVQENPAALRLTKTEDGDARWYSASNFPGEDFAPRPMAAAVSINDVDFRLLVEYTLQELYRDGTLAEILPLVMLPDEFPTMEIWPGPSSYRGISLSN